MLKRSCYLNSNKILWSWAWPQQPWLYQIHLVCAPVARTPFPNPKPLLRLLAAVSSCQMLLLRLPWHLHEQKQTAWLVSWVTDFLFHSLVRNIANAKKGACPPCCGWIIWLGMSVADGGKGDMGSPFYIVPRKSHVLCGLALLQGTAVVSSVDIRMERGCLLG